MRFHGPVLFVVFILLLLLVKSNKFQLQGCFIDLVQGKKDSNYLGIRVLQSATECVRIQKNFRRVVDSFFDQL